MKKLSEIIAEYNENREKIAAAEKEIEKLSMLDEIDAARWAKDYNKIRELSAAVKENGEKIKAASERVNVLTLAGLILKDNARAALIAEALPIIKKAFEKYEGKKYGERTREKIADEVRAAGFSVWTRGSSFDSRRYCLEISALTAAGFRDSACAEVSLYATSAEGGRDCFVDENNIICFSACHFAAFSKYTENVEKAAAELAEEIRNYNEKLENLKAAAAILDGKLASGMKRPEVQYSYRAY